jgi:(2S)-methylsuccinyl-CoA dehydrogenase
MREALEPVADVIDQLVARAARTLASHEGAADGDFQPDLYELAFIASEATAMRHLSMAANLPEPVTILAGSILLRSVRARLDGRSARLGLDADLLNDRRSRELAAAGHDAALHSAVVRAADDTIDFGLSAELRLAAGELRRLGHEVISPVAGEIHRTNLDIPAEVIDALAATGIFGLSIPEEYGGTQDLASPDHLAMVVATESLSRSSLAVGGSLITRPEILAHALLAGGTEEQRRRWLPGIASGEYLVAVAITEPDVGSDVAGLRLAARPHPDGWCLRGTKMWSTFAGRADLLMILARTEPDATLGHRGLSIFVLEKPRHLGHTFEQTQASGGSLRGQAIPTIGYRGMHSFELVFDDWVLPHESLVGGENGRGDGFRLQMGAFGAGRLQTAARAIGVMQSAFESARSYTAQRHVFGRRLDEYSLTTARLAHMVARIAANRVFSHAVAEYLSEPKGQVEAAMVKSLACRAAEEVTRDAMQTHGGYGYAEEYDVSRLFIDARVLTIFEGAEEVLAIKVIGRHLLAEHRPFVR